MIPAIALKNKLKIPVIGLGTWLLDGEKCLNSVKSAINLGYTHIDTAAYYNNHREIGKAIKGHDRKKLFITSKVWMDYLHYDDVLKSCETALQELETTYLDLYLIHWPNKRIPMKETFSALKKLNDEGKIKAVGVSNFSISHLKEALSVSQVPICINQVEFHPGLYQKDLLEFCMKNGIFITAYSPLARGNINQEKTIIEISKKHKKTPAQISLRWLNQKNIIAIPKGSSTIHLKENMDIFDFELSTEDLKKIDSLPDRRLINPSFSEFDRD